VELQFSELPELPDMFVLPSLSSVPSRRPLGWMMKSRSGRGSVLKIERRRKGIWKGAVRSCDVIAEELRDMCEEE
jgi:hypothetical protein